jgi:ABC-2 type transport system permease protein
MSAPLFRTMFKTNGKLMAYLGIGSFLFVILSVSIFPTMGVGEINQLLKTLPPSVQKMFGMESGIQNLDGFLAARHYSMIYLIFLMVYSIQTANQLVARLVDRGSMGYLLATPNSRYKIIVTQAVFLLTGLFVICLLTTLGGLLGDVWLLDQPSLNREAFLELNAVGFLLFAVICGYSFLFSCLFNDERRAVSASAGLTILFFALDLLGKMGEDLEWMRNISIFSTFEPAKIAQGSVEVAPICAGLGIASILLFAIAIGVFKRKDLPL